MKKNYGFIAPTIEEKHYVLGASPIVWEVLQPDGQWLDRLPSSEEQKKYGIETYNCTGFGTNRCKAILINRLAINDPESSERATGIFAGTKPPGNDPHTVAEAVRKNGFLPETMLPFSTVVTSVLEYFSWKGAIEKYCRAAADLWLKRYEFLHEWVWVGDISLADKQARLKEALTHSPLGVSVYAWRQDGSGLYVKNPGDQDCHWTTLVGYVEGVHWIVDDSYPDSEGAEIKFLRWDFDFGFAKKYKVLPTGYQGTIKPTRNPISAIIEFFSSLFKK